MQAQNNGLPEHVASPDSDSDLFETSANKADSNPKSPRYFSDSSTIYSDLSDHISANRDSSQADGQEGEEADELELLCPFFERGHCRDGRECVRLHCPSQQEEKRGFRGVQALQNYPELFFGWGKRRAFFLH